LLKTGETKRAGRKARVAGGEAECVECVETIFLPLLKRSDFQGRSEKARPQTGRLSISSLD